MGIVRSISAGAAAAAAVLAAAAALGWTQDAPPPTETGAPPAMQGGLPDLITGLTETPGCLGIETAQTSSGKQVIFAWFEDKKACLRWYYSEMHQQAMEMFFPGHDDIAETLDHRPMEGVPDDLPILAIASITMSDRPEFEESTLPISQIAIELYSPVTGGLFLGGRFAPDSLRVPDMHDYTPTSSATP